MISNNWLFIEPFVNIFITKEKTLLYNTLSGKALEYDNIEKPYKLIEKINIDANLFVLSLTNLEIGDSEIKNFIKKIKKNFMGDLIYNCCSSQKPIQIKPLFNVQKSMEILRSSKELSVGTKVMQNVIETTIFINEDCRMNCEACKRAFKQFPFCTKINGREKELDILSIKKILEDLSSSFVQKINITGGNILKYTKVEELIQLLKRCKSLVEFQIHYRNIVENFSAMQMLYGTEIILNILVDTFVDINILKNIERCLTNNIKYRYTFVVSNGTEVMALENLIADCKIYNYTIYPYYDNRNNNFFRKNIFVNKKDIFDAKPTIEDIYARKVMNPTCFGRLSIMCNGDIYANLNEKAIGSIKKSKLHEIVCNEMEKGKSWRKTRDTVVPCKGCLYKYICPPISNYEYCIGRFDLCTIN